MLYNKTNFDDSIPTKNNIDIVFSKILFCLTSAAMYNGYLEFENEISNELNEFKLLLQEYTNTENLLSLNFTKLDQVAENISTLDYKTVMIDGFYLEMADIWLSVLIGYYNDTKKRDIMGRDNKGTYNES